MYTKHPEPAPAPASIPVPLTYALVVDASCRTSMIRVRAHQTADTAPLRASTIISTVAAAIKHARPPALLVSAPGMVVDAGLLDAGWPAHVTLEVDSAALSDPSNLQVLKAAVARGHRLCFQPQGPSNAQMAPGAPGRSTGELPLPVALIADDIEQILHDPAPPVRARGRLVNAVGDLTTARAVFKLGAAGCIGWPIDDPNLRKPRALQPNQTIILELLRLLKDDAPPSKLDAVFKRDTAVAFKLLKLVNAAGTGLSAPVTSFQQAVMLLGYRKLQRWLVLLVASSNQDPEIAPLVSYSIMRGLLLDSMAPAVDPSLGDDLFLTGAFSMLDQITGTPFDRLFESVVLDAKVMDAVTTGTGPLAPYLMLARAAERDDIDTVRTLLSRLRLYPAALSHAVLAAACGMEMLDTR